MSGQLRLPAFRTLFVMNQKIGNSLDRRYVESELNSLGIAEYDRSSRLLAEKVFGSDRPVTEIDLTEEEQSMLRYYLGASTYGNTENRVNNRLHTIQTDSGTIRFHTKLRYCLERLFPGRNWCKDKYPFVYRHPWLLPAFWIWRFIKRVPAGTGKIRQELRTLKKVK